MWISPLVLVRAALFAALLSAAATLFRFASGVVPFSLVPFAVILGGLTLRPLEAFMGVSVYLGLGLVGVPVFAAPPFGGVMYILQPTFGFLLGFLLAAPLVARSREAMHPPTFLKVAVLAIVGVAVPYGPGLLYLWFVLNLIMGVEIGLGGVVRTGFLPFIAPDIVKALLAGALAWKARSLWKQSYR